MKALLVVDIQQEYMKKYPDGLLTEINRRIIDAEEQGELIIYIKNLRRLRGVNSSYEFADGLEVASANVFYKERASVFSNTALLDLLNENNIDEVEVTGIDGNCCVAGSAAEAVKLGYRAVMPCRLIGVQNPERFERKKLLLIRQGVIIE